MDCSGLLAIDFGVLQVFCHILPWLRNEELIINCSNNSSESSVTNFQVVQFILIYVDQA